ncbi:hypothetical protein G6O67_008474 [Ophiocordyceps sinensis]|uniref:Uncharacterized protein n=1 Tax=Ophiocordyceps sinensis TaxID=72228 RepID=A0A8H4PG28_9HYPO|nr:hypothetical protein G6O67_008474 [Ophiocordyceps sinensis]
MSSRPEETIHFLSLVNEIVKLRNRRDQTADGAADHDRGVPIPHIERKPTCSLLGDVFHVCGCKNHPTATGSRTREALQFRQGQTPTSSDVVGSLFRGNRYLARSFFASSHWTQRLASGLSLEKHL